MKALLLVLVVVPVLFLSSLAFAQPTPPSFFHVDFRQLPPDAGGGATFTLTFAAESLPLPPGTLEIYERDITLPLSRPRPYELIYTAELYHRNANVDGVGWSLFTQKHHWGRTYQWVARVSDADGKISPFSNSAQFTFPAGPEYPRSDIENPPPVDPSVERDLAYYRAQLLRCTDWNDGWYHHFASAGHVRSCLEEGEVDINQRDTDGRTLLHRIARDIAGRRKEFWVVDDIVDGASRKERRRMVKELLRWEELDIEAVDQKGWTAWRYAIKKPKGWSTAALLAQSGAQLHLTPTDKGNIERHWLPVLEAAHERGVDPAAIDPATLAGCQTAECLVEIVVPDAE